MGGERVVWVSLPHQCSGPPTSFPLQNDFPQMRIDRSSMLFADRAKTAVCKFKKWSNGKEKSWKMEQQCWQGAEKRAGPPKLSLLSALLLA